MNSLSKRPFTFLFFPFILHITTQQLVQETMLMLLFVIHLSSLWVNLTDLPSFHVLQGSSIARPMLMVSLQGTAYRSFRTLWETHEACQAWRVRLPVSSAIVYLLHSRPEGTTIDVKKSWWPKERFFFLIAAPSTFGCGWSRSHKQIGKFLNAMRKSKAIDVTEKKGVIHVSKIAAWHEALNPLESCQASLRNSNACGGTALTLRIELTRLLLPWNQSLQGTQDKIRNFNLDISTY